MKCFKKFRKETGITLVALVVTIVVLLILAGITITMLFSDNGIITKAREAADAVDKTQGDTLNGLNDLADDMGVTLGAAPKIKEQGKLVPITTKFAKYTDSTSNNVVPIPGGYGVAKDSSTGEKNTIGSGLVISDLENDTLDNELIDGKRGNQFVWVPVNDTQFSRMYDSTNKRGNLYEFGSYNGSTKTWSTYDEPQLITYSDAGYHEPDILTQYDGANSYNPSYFQEAISETMTGVQFKEQLEKEFEGMVKSVQRYKGFYIGRYETGNLSSSNNTVKAVVQKGATVGNANWYYQYQEIKNMTKDNNNVTSSMIWGCQFDRTLEWIAQTNEGGYGLLTNSKTWGNYNDSEGDAAANSGKGVQPSGTNPAWQKNHIYDLAGNAVDWTIEAHSTNCRVYRGGSSSTSGSGFPVSGRNYEIPYKSKSSRLIVYVNL